MTTIEITVDDQMIVWSSNVFIFESLLRMFYL